MIYFIFFCIWAISNYFAIRLISNPEKYWSISTFEKLFHFTGTFLLNLILITWAIFKLVTWVVVTLCI